MAGRLIGWMCALVLILWAADAALSQEACKADAAKAADVKAAPQVNTYKCDKTGKTWTQAPSEKKSCPYCGAANPDCGTLVKSDANMVWSCMLHKFISEDKPGRCKVCNLKLVEVPASAVIKTTGKGLKKELVDVSKEPEECER